MKTAAVSTTQAHWRDFIAPKYWHVWLGVLMIRVLAMLPYRIGLLVGSGLGSLLYRVVVKRRRVTQVNVQCCFPELSAKQQQRLVKSIFRSNGIGLVETAWAHWGNCQGIIERTTLKGFELLDEALSQQRGVILLGGHFSTLDLGSVLFSTSGYGLDTIYRKHNNPLIDYIINIGRSRYCNPVERKNLRKILSNLRNNHCVWYAPDQDFGRDGAVFVPFFGQTAATIVATSRMTKLNNSPILMLAHYRNQDNSGYTMEITPVENFSTGDDTQDAILVNQVLEAAIRKAPDQYMWVHKRFKTQPDGNQKLYKEGGC